MTQDDKKKAAAKAALQYVEDGQILGVGTGSTVNYFIDDLKDIKDKIKAAVSSSIRSAERLKALGIPVLSLNEVGTFDIYVDGADEINPAREMIKGGGAALTREKIVSQAARKFVCIVDDTKLVDVLGKFPLPIEVIPMARTHVKAQIEEITGGEAVYREGVITDNGNEILDVHGLKITEPKALEERLNQIPGVVTVGIFARRPADILITGTDKGAVIS